MVIRLADRLTGNGKKEIRNVAKMRMEYIPRFNVTLVTLETRKGQAYTYDTGQWTITVLEESDNE